MFVQSCCFRAMWLYSGKVVELGKSGCIGAKLVVSGVKLLKSKRSGCIRTK